MTHLRLGPRQLSILKEKSMYSSLMHDYHLSIRKDLGKVEKQNHQ